ncbi:hypothetical protein VTK26DRAFT_3277 [Humicola hyalothermophila]
MVHTTSSAGSLQAARTASRPSTLSQSRRTRTSGSFHAGEPFPQLSPLGESPPSSSRPRRSSPVVDSRHPLRRQSTIKYHTFPTSPPSTPSEQQPSSQEPQSWSSRLFWRPRTAAPGLPDTAGAHDTGPEVRGLRGAVPDHDAHESPLPWSQLSLLALLSLAEQTALNSIGPYLPAMVASFDEVPDGQEGLYVGLLASAFALAQLTTNLLWGYLSDRVGRKPTMLLGTLLLMVCFLFFGLCKTYLQLVMVHAAMGLLNGNAAIVPTCLGEVTDRSNQSKAFTWLPVIYSLGSITGPALGGLLVGSTVAGHQEYPFLAPNIVAAALLLASVIVLAVWFEETLHRTEQQPLGTGFKHLSKAPSWVAMRWSQLKTGFSRWRNSSQSGSDRPSERLTASVIASDVSHEPDLSGDDDYDHDDNDYTREHSEGLICSPVDREGNEDIKDAKEHKSALHLLKNRNTVAILGTYLVFQLGNISFNSLYPIFVSAPPPIGRGLGPGTIGLGLSFAGLATILFQISLFQKLKASLGNLGTYRYSLLGMTISMAVMPWIGYLDGGPPLGLGSSKAWLYSELGLILLLKSICAIGGLSSVMLLITNSAPSHETLGTLNGMAQSLSAAGRSFGPLLSGGIFTLSTGVRPKGEALAWGSFAGVMLIGWIGSYAISGSGLESSDWEHLDSEDADSSGDDEEPDTSN